MPHLVLLHGSQQAWQPPPSPALRPTLAAAAAAAAAGALVVALGVRPCAASLLAGMLHRAVRGGMVRGGHATKRLRPPAPILLLLLLLGDIQLRGLWLPLRTCPPLAHGLRLQGMHHMTGCGGAGAGLGRQLALHAQGHAMQRAALVDLGQVVRLLGRGLQVAWVATVAVEGFERQRTGKAAPGCWCTQRWSGA